MDRFGPGACSSVAARASEAKVRTLRCDVHGGLNLTGKRKHRAARCMPHCPCIMSK